MTRALAFFGAFNPPTVAHVELARFALEQTGREAVVFVPSKSAYIAGEQGKDFAYGDDARLRMLRAIAATRPWMAVTDVELCAPEQPRTYDTLCRGRIPVRPVASHPRAGDARGAAGRVLHRGPAQDRPDARNAAGAGPTGAGGSAAAAVTLSVALFGTPLPSGSVLSLRSRHSERSEESTNSIRR